MVRERSASNSLLSEIVKPASDGSIVMTEFVVVLRDRLAKRARAGVGRGGDDIRLALEGADTRLRQRSAGGLSRRAPGPGGVARVDWRGCRRARGTVGVDPPLKLRKAQSGGSTPVRSLDTSPVLLSATFTKLWPIDLMVPAMSAMFRAQGIVRDDRVAEARPCSQRRRSRRRRPSSPPAGGVRGDRAVGDRHCPRAREQPAAVPAVAVL